MLWYWASELSGRSGPPRGTGNAPRETTLTCDQAATQCKAADATEASITKQQSKTQ